MLGKGNRDDVRQSVRCYGCGQVGHIARDNPSCYRKMKKKSEEYPKRKGAEATKRRNKDREDDKQNTGKTDYCPESSDEEDAKKQNEDDELVVQFRAPS